MKTILLILSILCYSIGLSAQNTFPENGFAGVGTTTPNAPLHIKGTYNNISLSRNALILDNANVSGDRSSDILWLANGVAKWEMGNDVGANGGQNFYLFDLENTSAPRLFIDSSGNMGLGTASPTAKLSVNGNIRAREIKVEANNWPDYVFKTSYKLPELSQLKDYIDQYHHLPEIPSGKDIEEHGLDVGKMNKLLMKKIEELTLYLIQKDQAMLLQDERIKKLEKRINTLPF
jgi:hypothetical protein